jgi:hypothetical protein
MIGDLTQRGIGFYLEAEEIMDEAAGFTQREKDLMVNLNPGEIIGYSLGAIYVLSPYDFIPDFIPVIGYLDDLAIFRLSGAIGGAVYDILDIIF